MCGDGHHASGPSIHPYVDPSDEVVAERRVFIVLCLVQGSHGVVKLFQRIPKQQGEVTLLVKRGVDTVRCPLRWWATILVVFLIILVF